MKYNLSKIMLKAWKSLPQDKEYRSALQKHFTEHGYLQRQKKSMQRELKSETGSRHHGRETNTFAKWKELGYKVKHGASKHYSDVL